MKTKKQRRSEERISHAKSRKADRFANFLFRVAKRQMENQEDAQNLTYNFCCRPDSLQRSRDEFVAAGQQLCGGAAVLFRRGELKELLPGWQCQNRRRPAVFTIVYLEAHYLEDGRYRDPYANGTSTSGSIDWT